MLTPIHLKKWLRHILQIILVIALTLFIIRVYDSQRGEPLSLWHKVSPNELTSQQIDQTDWLGYLAAEQKVFKEVEQKVASKIKEYDRHSLNRYFAKSPIYPESFSLNWNRSFILKPTAEVKGAVVLLHGLTDSPYSLRHIAEHYQQRGFVVVAIRMPGHGTVPGALTNVHWEGWLAATRLAVREAIRLKKPQQPLHLVGYSNGGALAMMYAVETVDNPQLAKPNQIILISPMIGVTSFARFVGLAGLPAIFPPFAKAAWIDVIPEYNPFKYNSFPVNGARQSYELTTALQKRLSNIGRDQIKQLPPVLTFSSVVDSTVSTVSVIDLYNQLASKDNALVLFDVNRTIKLGPLLKDKAYYAVNELLPSLPRNYQTTVVTNESPESSHAVAYIVEAGQTDQQIQPLKIEYPKDIYSLSHIALPFPETDSLYGRQPDKLNEFGLSLGVLAIRGERGVLFNSLDNLLRLSYNPFFSYLVKRIDQVIDSSLTKN